MAFKAFADSILKLRHQMHSKLLLYCSPLLLLSLGHANESSFFNDAKRGWHYYEIYKKDIPPKTDEEKQKELKIRRNADDEFIDQIPIDNLSILTAEEFTETFEKVRKISVMNPTKRNVKVMQIMNKWQIDQSDKFTKVWALNLLEDPDLEYPEIRADKIGRNEMYRLEEEKKKKFFTDHKDNFIYVVFYSSANERANEAQRGIYKDIKNRYGVDVEFIDVDERIDLVHKLGLKTTPENFFLLRNSKGEAIWQRVKAGLANRDDVVKNTIFAYENEILERDK